jgi:hypothetical protein
MDESDLTEGIEGITGTLKQFAPIILLIVLVAAALLAYFYLLPRPASLNVSISQMDGGVVSSPVNVYITDLSGNAVGGASGSVIAQNGQAYFPSLPSGTFMLNVDGGKGYQLFTQQIQLPSGGSLNQQVQLSVANQLTFVDNDVPTLMAQGCQDSFYVDLANGGPTAFDAQLVVEGSDSAFTPFFTTGQPVQIAPNQTQRMYVNVSLPSGTSNTLSATNENIDIRVKGTTVEIPLSLTITPPVQASLTPSSISIDSTSPSNTQMTLTDSGQTPLDNFSFSFYPDSGLSQACGANGSGCFSINLLSNAGLNTLQPGQSISFELSDNGIPSTLAPVTNGYNMDLVLTAACLNLPGITTNINVNPPQTTST